MKSWAASVAVLAALAVFAGCASTGAPRGAAEGTGAVQVGSPIPDLELDAVDGGKTRLSAFRGKVVLLDVWASWCEPCKKELPLLDDMTSRLAADGVEILAVSIDERRENMDAFLGATRKWRIRFFHDPVGAIAERLQPPRMPTSYVIDRNGIVREVNLGFEDADAPQLEARLKALAAAR